MISLDTEQLMKLTNLLVIPQLKCHLYFFFVVMIIEGLFCNETTTYLLGRYTH